MNLEGLAKIFLFDITICINIATVKKRKRRKEKEKKAETGNARNAKFWKIFC